MNDNGFDFTADYEKIMREIQELTNIGWNGRFFIAGLLAIALTIHQPFVALLAACILGISVIVEQIPGIVGVLLRIFVYGLSGGLALTLAVLIWLAGA